MNDQKTFLGTEPIGKLLLKLAIPTVIAQVVNMLYNIVDRIYIGHIPHTGALALTGLGVCMPIILIVTAFAAFVASGGAPKASIAMGKNDYDEAEKILGNCITLQFIISLSLMIILKFTGKDLLIFFGASKNTLPYAMSYMRIYILGTLFVELTLGLNAFITAQGFATTGMATVLIGAITNIVLDPIFIFGFHMGVQGAALATILSQGLSCIWVVLFLRSKKSIFKIKAKYLKPEASIILPCLGLGASTFVMQSSESIILLCFNSSLLKYGGDLSVGAMTILSSVMQFALLPLQGLAQGAQPITSYNFGAQSSDRVKESFFKLLKASLFYSSILWLLIMAFPKIFASLFSSDAQLMNYTASVLRIYCGALILMGIQIPCQMTFVSIGNAKASIFLAVLRKFILLIPLIYLLPHLLPNKAIAVYTAEPVADIFAMTTTCIVFFLQFRKVLKELKRDA